MVVAWLSENALLLISVVTLRWVRLALGWVTVSKWVNHLGMSSLVKHLGWVDSAFYPMWDSKMSISFWAMVSVVNWQPTGCLLTQADWLGPHSTGWQPPGAVLHLSHEPGELSQCFKKFLRANSKSLDHKISLCLLMNFLAVPLVKVFWQLVQNGAVREWWHK